MEGCSISSLLSSYICFDKQLLGSQHTHQRTWVYDLHLNTTTVYNSVDGDTSGGKGFRDEDLG